MAKAAAENKPTSYLLTTEAKELLKKLAEQDGRSMSKQLEHLIKEAAKKLKQG